MLHIPVPWMLWVICLSSFFKGFLFWVCGYFPCGCWSSSPPWIPPMLCGRVQWMSSAVKIARPEKNTPLVPLVSYVCWHVKPAKYIIYMNYTTIVDIAGKLLRGITVSQIVFFVPWFLFFFLNVHFKSGRRLKVPSPIYEQNQNSAKRKEIRIRCSHDLYSKIYRFTSTTIMVFRVSSSKFWRFPPQSHAPKEISNNMFY